MACKSEEGSRDRGDPVAQARRHFRALSLQAGDEMAFSEGITGSPRVDFLGYGKMHDAAPVASRIV
jgi:hypothetical protein